MFLPLQPPPLWDKQGENYIAEKVMLFIDGAQVTRTKQVDIPAGNSTLIFTGLSPIWMHKVCRSAQRKTHRYGSQPAVQLYRQPCRQRKTTKPAKELKNRETAKEQNFCRAWTYQCRI